MDLTFFTNGWSVLALFIVCWCVNEIIKNIIYGIMTTKSIREMLMKYAFKKDKGQK